MSNQFGFLSSIVHNNKPLQSTTSQSTKPVQSPECKQLEERAQTRARSVIDDKKRVEKRLQQLKMEDVVLNVAVAEA